MLMMMVMTDGVICRVSAGCRSVSAFFSESTVFGWRRNRLGGNSLFKSHTATC